MGYDIKNLAKVTKAFFIWVFFIFLSHNTTKAFPALKKKYPKKGTSTPFKGIQCLPYTY